jgi:hypothetical protein
MKKISLFVLILVMFILAACVAVPAVAPTSSFAQSLVALPDEGRLLILSLLTAGLTWLLLQLSVLLKIELSGYVQPLAMALAPVLIATLENYLQMIPPALDNIALTVIHLIILLVGSVGTFMLFRRSKSFKQILA